MAKIAGEGTANNPYIIETWADFNTYNTSGYQNTYTKYKNPHYDYSWNTWNIPGSGTSEDPYIVSTYDELVHATGAGNIYDIPLINKATMMYKYGDIFCKYDTSLSTFNFNTLAPDGLNSIKLNTHMDFNGWTLLNMRITATESDIFYQAYSGGWIKNARILNFQGVGNSLFGCVIYDTVFQGQVTNAGDNARLMRYNAGNSVHTSIYNSSVKINISAVGYRFYLCDTSQPSYDVISNSIIDLCVNCDSWNSGYSNSFNTVTVTNSIIKGNSPEATVNTSNNIFYTLSNSILDFKIGDTRRAFAPPYNNCSNSLFNNEKLNVNKTGMTGVTTAQLQQPSYLRSIGFPIAGD